MAKAVSRIHLLVGEPDPRFAERWQAVFADVPEVEVCAVDMTGLRARADVQCLVVTNREAGENWCGGPPVPNGVYFCRTAVFRGWGERPVPMPPYVVSTPAWVGPAADASVSERVGRGLNIILQRLEQANAEGMDPAIQRLALLGEFLAGVDSVVTARRLTHSQQRLQQGVEAAQQRGDATAIQRLTHELQEIARRLALVTDPAGGVDEQFEAQLRGAYAAYAAYLRG
ncbi:MAG TPA: hypothetical protein VKV26_03695 [Dehalococcoidia bacterium]|nr:hypothetical protein [Dehalococcoidia bacterium]